MENIKPFTGGINAFGSNYYIHFHQENIGLANGDLHAPNIAAIFANQRQQATQVGIQSYKGLLFPNISSDSQELLNELFNNDDILTEFDNQIKKQLQENLSKDNRLEQLMGIQRSVVDPKSKFINTFQNAGSQISSFDELLESLSKAANLLKTKEGGELAALLIKNQSINSKAPNIKIMGSNLQKALKEFIIKNNGKSFSQLQARKAAEQINKLASTMTMKITKSGTSYSKEAIQHLIDNIFNVGFAEGLAAVGARIGNQSINKSFLDLTGDKSHKLFIFEPGKDWYEFNNTPADGKADSTQKNIKMSFEYHAGLDHGNVIFNLGLSNKFYRTQHFGNLDQRTKLEVSGGSGGLTIGTAIEKLFGDNFTKYLAFNIIAHRSERPLESQELQNLFLKRYITNFLSTRGGKNDFAQFIIANGEVISIWELILYARDHFLGYSQSLSEGRQQPIAISFPDVPVIEARTKSEHSYHNAYQRCVDVNSMIHKAKISTHIHVDKIAQAYKK